MKETGKTFNLNARNGRDREKGYIQKEKKIFPNRLGNFENFEIWISELAELVGLLNLEL